MTFANLKRRGVYGSGCRIAEIIADLAVSNPDEHDQLLAVIDDPHVSPNALTEGARDLGIKVAQNAFGKHRTGRCACATSQEN